VRKDLGREEFPTWFYELALIEHDCEHVIRHLKKWT
jgi:aldehyde dehydrogenase (NAD+)